ncbi:MAG: hypothetical protein M1838_000006 [Thelocarpon superellum]|nr:MAG: hypothetical protein M1838_000006 [Thelocarpon superellum]
MCKRLMAAICASGPLTLNYQTIATMFGEGATYDSIEGQFRIIKRQAETLKQEVESGARPPAPTRGAGKRGSSASTKRASPNTTPAGRKRGAVNGGRITKARSAHTTPTKLQKGVLTTSTSTSASTPSASRRGSDESMATTLGTTFTHTRPFRPAEDNNCGAADEEWDDNDSHDSLDNPHDPASRAVHDVLAGWERRSLRSSHSNTPTAQRMLDFGPDGPQSCFSSFGSSVVARSTDPAFPATPSPSFRRHAAFGSSPFSGSLSGSGSAATTLTFTPPPGLAGLFDDHCGNADGEVALGVRGGGFDAGDREGCGDGGSDGDDGQDDASLVLGDALFDYR